MIKQKVKKVLRAIGKPAFKNELQALQTASAAYQRMIEQYEKDLVFQHPSCEGIVFSKDRAMQLHALLLSYFACVKNPAKLSVLYTTTSKMHASAYEDLKKIFADKPVTFSAEKSFKKDLEELLEKINTTTLFFMTDDGMFIDTFDMQEVIAFNPAHILPSLIKGKDLTYCYIRDQQQALPEFIKPSGVALSPFMICWEWSKAQPRSDWAYPMSVDITFYNKKEIQTLIKNISYKAPNSLEAALHNNYASIFLQRKGLCYEKAKYVNIVANVVNTEHKNRHAGLHSVESLLEKWQAGYRIQYELFLGKSCSEAETAPFTFIAR
ncbi:hypothetical protein [Paracnuella aquatica]|uniref:hypothetical protein n=1 Tax=Paracnuella aquatica TaxID=2268757 RepID=UPI000DEEE6FE|nr:hypothetical protein [Paracnuella aquatica]RPD48279.1 hypothetical protein DRJ53_11075 [Paracnuella aquatica]